MVTKLRQPTQKTKFECSVLAIAANALQKIRNLFKCNFTLHKLRYQTTIHLAEILNGPQSTMILTWFAELIISYMFYIQQEFNLLLSLTSIMTSSKMSSMLIKIDSTMSYAGNTIHFDCVLLILWTFCYRACTAEFSIVCGSKVTDVIEFTGHVKFKLYEMAWESGL